MVAWLPQEGRRRSLLVAVVVAAVAVGSDEDAKRLVATRRANAAWLHAQLDEDLCMGGPVQQAHNVFLRERNATTGAVALPPRPADLDCYTRTVWRRTLLNTNNPDHREEEAGEPSPSRRHRVAVLINGEVSRLDPSATFARHVIQGWSSSAKDVVLVLSLQNRREAAQRGEWHAARFGGLEELDDAAVEAKVVAVGRRAIAAGAEAVQSHVYDLIRRPPLMPSKWTGGPGKSLRFARFQVAWASYPLHLLVHSLIFKDLERYEAGHRDDAPTAMAPPRNFDFVLKMRADTVWVADAPEPSAAAVVVKECLPWGGVNDKVAILPRRYAGEWLRLLEQYYDATLQDYKNSEQFQLRLAERHGIPIERRVLAASDFYHWLPALDGAPGCFAANYAKAECFPPDVWKSRVEPRICAKV